MANFKANDGKEYTVAIDGYVLHRARTHGKLSLTSLFDGSQRNADGGIAIDPALLIELCYYGCEHNAKIKSGKVTKEDFLRSLTGLALTGAIQATAEALTVCLSPPAGTPQETTDGKGADDDSPLEL